MAVVADLIAVEFRDDADTTWEWLGTTAADAATRPVVVDDIEISWSRPSPRDHPDPSEIAFTVFAPRHAPEVALLTYDRRVRVRVRLLDEDTLEDTALLLACHGWITGWTRTRLDATRDAYTVVLDDITARASKTMIGWTPRGAETAAARLGAINTAAGFMVASPSAVNPALLGTVLPRDVDNAPALDVARDTMPVGVLLVPHGSDGSYMVPELGTGRAMENVGDGPLRLEAGLRAPRFNLDAADIEDTGTTLDRLGYVNRVKYRVGNNITTPPTEYTDTVKPAGTYLGQTSATLEVHSDTVYSLYAVETLFPTWARTLMAAAAEPRTRPNRTTIRAGLDTMAALLQRWNRAVLYIENLPTGSDHYPVQLITAATLHLSPGNPVELQDVDLAPGSAYGYVNARFADLPRFAHLGPNPDKINNPSRISDFAAVTTVNPPSPA